MQIVSLVLFFVTSSAFADFLHTKSVKIVTNLPVGAAPDVFVRKLSQQLEFRWKVPVVVENKPGGAGLVALEYFNNLKTNTTNIFFSDFGLAVATPILYNRENLFDGLRAITIGYNTVWMIIAPPGVKDFESLQKAIKTTPQFGSYGVGSSGHLCGNELLSILKLNAVHIPYKDFGTWFVDTSNGQVSFGCTSVGSSENYYKSGKLNYIATTTNERDPFYPNIPTVKELTGQSFDTGEVFSAFYMSSTTSNSVAASIEKDIRTETQSSAMIDLVKQLRGHPITNTSQEMTKLREEKISLYRSLIRKYNIRIDQ